MFKTKILGTGSYLPERILSNKDIEQLVETSDEWIYERTGIRERHIAAEGQCTSDLALNAAQNALKMAGLTAQDLEMIIVATVSPDTVMPSTSCNLQTKLGCPAVLAFDLSAACSGFVFALATADQYIKTGKYKNILVVGAETLSSLVNYRDRNTCILFGDGAGAAVVGRSTDDSEILSSHMHVDGSLGHLLEIPAGGSQMPLSQHVLDHNLQFVQMKGKEIFKNAVRTLVECSKEALDHNNMTKEDIHWLIPHQANARITEAVARHFKLPSEKVIENVEHTGNTSAATIPIALDEAIRDGRIQRGQYVLLTAFGAGLTSGSLLLKF